MAIDSSIIMHIYKDIIRLAEYIFANLREYSITPLGNHPEEILINFNDIPNFVNTYGLASFRDNQYSDYYEYYNQCDLVIQLEKLDNYSFGSMEENDPILIINSKKISTPAKFKRNSKDIKNSIIHELSHYIQNQSKNKKFQSDNFDIHGKLGDIITDKKYYEYYIYYYILYAIGLRESEARVNGFVGTLECVLDDLKKKYKTSNEDELIDNIVFDKDFDNNEIHTVLFIERLKEIEKDTWEKFKRCKDNADKYLQDSPIYIILRLSENRGNLPELIMPTQDQNNLINSIKNKEDFEKYQKLLVGDYKQKMKVYIDGLKEVTKFMLHK